MTLLYLVAAWVAGIFLSSSGHTEASLWLALAAASLILAGAIWRSRNTRLLCLCGALFMLGAGRYAWAARRLPPDHIIHAADTGYVTLTGVIVHDADERDNHTNLRVQVESIRQDDQTHSAQGLVLVQAPRHGTYVYGDRITASGSLLTPPEFDDFSYRDYLARRGIHAMIPNAQVEILAHDQGQPWYTFLYKTKARARETINRWLPSPQAPLLNGILLGIESGIPDDVRDSFNTTGTAHVIAISGANIIIMIGVLMCLLEPPLGRRRAGWITLLGVGVYTLLVGADPSVVRAAIMGGLALIAAQTGRRAHGLTSLAFAVWLMTLWNPMTLWDVGFQLSVAATAGVVLFSHKFTRRFENMFKRGFAQSTARQLTRLISEPIIVSLAAQITTTPLILLYFGRLSLVTLAANILIAPAQAYIMIVGWLAVLIGMIWSALGEPLAWVAWIPLTYTLNIVEAFARFEWASIEIDFPASCAWGVYSALLAAAWISVQHRDDRAALFRRIRQSVTTYTLLTAGVILAILVWTMALSFPDRKLHVWFLDVGHGHAVLIQTPNGAQILIDGGPSPTLLQNEIGDTLPFWDRHLDLLIVTQPKNSAINALPALLDRYEVQQVLTNGQVADTDNYQALTRLWQSNGVEVLPVTAGYQVQTGDGVRIEILHPQTTPAADAEPETVGIVIRVSYGDTSFLITPDLDQAAEQVLLNAGWYAGSTVLELPAYGEDAANPETFLRAIHPQTAVVSVGAGNRSGLPDPAAQERLASLGSPTLYRTDRHGTVEMVTDGRTLWIYTDDD
jgi:competence protein ComEC